MCHEACDGDDVERDAPVGFGARRSASTPGGISWSSASRSPERGWGARGNLVSPAGRRGVAISARVSETRFPRPPWGPRGSGQAGFIELRPFRHAPLPGEDDEFGMGGFGSDETTANGSRWIGRSGSCADGRVVRARGAMEAEGRVDSAHSRVFPGKSTANGRFLGFSRGTLSFFPTGAMDYSILHARPRSSYPRALAGVASCRGDARL